MPNEIVARTDDARNLSAGTSAAPTMQPVTIRSSRVKLSLGLLGITPLFAMGVGVMVTGGSAFAALFAIIPRVVIGFKVIREILDRRPRITIDEKGICDRGNVFGLIEWDDVTGAYRGRLLSRSIVFVQVRNPAKYNDRLSPLRQLLPVERTRPGCYYSAMIRSARLALIGTVMFAGCETVTAPARDGSPIQTDRTVYILQEYTRAHLSTAIATYVNHTDRPVYYPRCTSYDTGPMYFLRRTAPDSARPLWTDLAWGCLGGVPAGVIAPGASISVRVRLGSIDEPSMNPPIQRQITGTMRVQFELCAAFIAGSDQCVPLPQAEQQSNAFVVRY